MLFKKVSSSANSDIFVKFFLISIPDILLNFAASIARVTNKGSLSGYTIFKDFIMLSQLSLFKRSLIYSLIIGYIFSLILDS